jgi:heme-degrading monooxygenase HmoA
VTVIMIAEAPGVDATFANGLLEAGIADEMVKAPGFVSHSSGASSSGYRVVEVWESREAHRAWYDDHVAPNLPPGMGPIPAEYIDVVLSLPQT